MKKLISLILTIALCLGITAGLTSCNADAAEDWTKIQEKGKFVCGITDYEPMNYYEDGELVGFDTEFAKAVAAELGVDVEFKVIEWDSKYLELNKGKIDFIWNGYTLGNEEDGTSRKEYVDFSYAYLKNVQVVVTKADKLDELSTVDAFKGKSAVAEGGSSGVAVAKKLTGDDNKVSAGFSSQKAALLDLSMGKCDFAVVDYQIAKTLTGEGNEYDDLAINPAFTPESEVYAIGCRKGSPMVEKINAAIVKLSENGTLAEIAAKYGLENDLIAEIGKE